MTNSQLQNKNEFKLLRELEDRFDAVTGNQPNIIPEKLFLKTILKRVYEGRLKELEKHGNNNNIRVYRALAKDLMKATELKLITYDDVWVHGETEIELALTKERAENYKNHFEIQFLG